MEADEKSADLARPGCIGFETGRVGNFLCDLQLSPQIFLQPLDLQECTVPHLKDLINICLELEAQGCGMTLKRFYVGSKYPYFISYRGKWLYLFYHECILFKERANEINPTSKCTQETQIYSSIFEHIDFVKIIDYTNFFLMDPLRTFQTGG